jgi:arginyl-tRNA synthetase
MKEIVAELLSHETGIEKNHLLNLIEIPPREEMGDFAFPCFSLAKTLKKNPMEIAKELGEKIRKNLSKEVSGVDFSGGYVNFFINKKFLAEKIFKDVSKKNFGENNTGKNKTVVIDMSAPNIAKPFGIGHLRSTIIGNSISNILSMNGYKTKKINYLGDWGTQFGKLILAYKKWGDENKLKKDAISHLQELYVKVNADELLEDSAREEFKKLEDGDKENKKLWDKFRKLSIEEFDKIYELLGIEFDEISGESKYNNKMDSVIELLEKKNLIKKDEGADIVDLKDEGIGVALIKKSDGTSLYATRDLAAAIDRKNKYNFDMMIYEVGQEQKLHFKQLFKILEKLGFEWAKNCVHVPHGLYLDKDGKKFATRKGKTILMKDILDEVMEKAKSNLREKENLKENEIEERSIRIALAAIFYGDLKNSPENNIIFDADKFLNFEGDTGPYLLYSYARANSITRKKRKEKEVEIFDIKDAESKLIKKINDFPEIIKKASQNLAPNIIANYSFELAQIFNEFYHSCPVLGSKEESFRLHLTNAFKITLKKSLDILGIKVLEEM